MSIALIFAAMFFALIASGSLMGGALAGIERPLFNKWGTRLVSLVDLVILRPMFAVTGVHTSRWTIQAKSKACIAMGLLAFILMQWCAELAARR